MKTRSAFGQGKMSGALYMEYRPEYSFIIKENPDPPSENPLAPFLQQMKLRQPRGAAVGSGPVEKLLICVFLYKLKHFVMSGFKK